MDTPDLQPPYLRIREAAGSLGAVQGGAGVAAEGLQKALYGDEKWLAREPFERFAELALGEIEIAHEQSRLRQIPANIFAFRTRGFPHFQLRRGAPIVAAPQKGLNDAVMSSIEGIDTAAFAKGGNGFGNAADVGANGSGAIPRVIEIRLKGECLFQTGKCFGVLKVP